MKEFVTNYNNLIYGLYFNAALSIIKVGLCIYASFWVWPKSLNRHSYMQKLHLWILPLKGQREILSEEEYQRLKLYKNLWAAVLVLIFLRLVVALWLSNLDFILIDRHPHQCRIKCL